MDVAILPPHDCLKGHYSNHHSRRSNSLNKTHRHPNNHLNSNVSRSINRRRRNSNSPPPPPSSSGPTTKAHPRRIRIPDSPQMVMGQVRILKRGEEIKPVNQAPPMSGPVGPMMDAFGIYAGSACVTSPPPSELPLPTFFMKVVTADNNQKIASDLRRALNICS